MGWLKSCVGRRMMVGVAEGSGVSVLVGVSDGVGEKSGVGVASGSPNPAEQAVKNNTININKRFTLIVCFIPL